MIRTSDSRIAQTSQIPWVMMRSGRSRRDRLGIQHVQRIAERVCGAHHSVDLAGRGVRIDYRSRYARDAGMQTLRRIVAVVRNADEHLERAERADDLGGRGKKRDDAH